MKPTERFSNRVDNYVKYRPTYPAALLQFMQQVFALRQHSPIADVGAGTGILTALLLQDGYEVFAVEPNDNMRQSANQQLSHFEHFHSINGSGEATTLPNGSVDLVTVAQAFHWLQPDKARQEFLRILKPGGHIALIWNLRTTHTPFEQAFEDIKQKYGHNYTGIRKSHDPELKGFFGDLGLAEKTFTHSMRMDLPALKGQLLSSSFMPLETDPTFVNVMEELEAAFAQYQENGLVTITYDTKLHYNP
ncbi:Ubiquinone/menaquinone biosynthesis C-methylase UbiE [Chitinophaga costaii]|uniref:Ubiquinone/menaquinone biosynthesis C-methylase UbiE n=1 Tax=Chitinophaga costaii TaxID=1335309 RepID=A0A1C3YZZ1_9BACT|nr:class I SAM-dependent methyltransferase [Chitinophaga costaii]PUZ30177.1 class I SAM-dependent methyltransferase [Chitinophaga costaii]SCB75704.1 Ubiquinone/menaquinone biosynthesis C-methylase UbiE [Chitinophaga costaii]